MFKSLSSVVVPSVSDTLAPRIQAVRWGQLHGLNYVFETREGGLGVGFYFSPPAQETIMYGDLYGAQTIAKLISVMPDGYTVQWVRSNVSNLRRAATAYFEQEHLGDIPTALLQERAEFLQSVQSSGLPDPTRTGMTPSIQQGYFFIHTPPMARYNAKGKRQLEAVKSAELGFVATIELVVRELGSTIDMWQVTPAMFCNYVVGLLNPIYAQSEDFLPRVSESEIPEAIAAMVQLTDIDDRGFVSEHEGIKTYFRLASMMWQPKTVTSGLLTPVVEDSNDCTSITSIRVLPQEATSLAIKAKLFITQRSETPFNVQANEAAIGSLSDALARNVNREKWVGVRTHIIVTADSNDAAEKRVQTVKNAMKMQSFESGVETEIASSLILHGCLPFTPQSYERAFARSRRMLSEDAASIAPVGGTWEGFHTKDPYAMYMNRWAKPLLVNPHVADGNANALVIGGSGSGKSYFVHDLMLQTSRLPSVYQYLLSIKDDYEWMTRLMGKTITFELENLPCINPFFGEPTTSNREMWEQILVQVIKSFPNELVNKEDRALLDMAALNAYHHVKNSTQGHGVMGLDHIASQLLTLGTDVSARAKDLHKRMADFIKGGKYETLLNGRSELNPADRQIFFNLKNVITTAAGSVTIACLMRFLDDVMTMKERRGNLKFCCFDEGSFLNDDELGGMFISRSVRTYRSLGGQVTGVSQQLDDWKTGFGKAMLSNTATKYILKQATSELVTEVAQLLGLNPKETELVSSLHMQPGYYSEFFVSQSGSGSTVGRVYAMPLLNAIATTNSDDFGPRLQLLEQCSGNYWQATQEFARRYPHGFKDSRSLEMRRGLVK